MMLFQIKDGKIVNKEAYFDFMLNIKDGDYEIVPYKRDRSSQQNRYYWMLLGLVSNDTGHDVNDLHEKMRQKFLYVPENKNQLAYCRSTSKLTTEEFTKYIDQVKNFFAEFGIVLPEASQIG